MFKAIFERVTGRYLERDIIRQNKELMWAHIYHDSIRDKEWLTQLPLNIGRYAGNYSFFFVLSRILGVYTPKDILEFGLGESSKLISTYLENSLTDSTHTIIEHDSDWGNSFKAQFKFTERSMIHILELQEKYVNGYKTKGYKGIDEFISKKYDLYLIDGPFGSPKYSRYDIVNLAERFTIQDEFIIILDDYDRYGEQQTFKCLMKVLQQKGIEILIGYYEGVKTVAVIGTKKYKFVKSM
jgi:hypothetical protein